jgi:hypothetical protein
MFHYVTWVAPPPDPVAFDLTPFNCVVPSRFTVADSNKVRESLRRPVAARAPPGNIYCILFEHKLSRTPGEGGQRRQVWHRLATLDIASERPTVKRGSASSCNKPDLGNPRDVVIQWYTRRFAFVRAHGDATLWRRDSMLVWRSSLRQYISGDTVFVHPITGVLRKRIRHGAASV